MGVHDKSHDSLHKQIYGQQIQEYVRYKLSWTPEMMNDTNWDALSGALGSYPLHARTTRMKAIYGWLHTHQWKSRIYSSSSICPFCDNEESNDHILRCPATTTHRQEGIAQFISNIKEKTPRNMIMIIQQRLEEALTITPMDIHPEDMTYDDLNSAIESQDELGWINFLRGRHSIKSEEAYDIYMASGHGKETYRSARKWATNLIQASLTLLVEIWFARNEQFHNQPDEEGNLPPKIEATHQRVRELYADQTMYTRATRAQLFDMTIDQRLKQKQFQLVKWIQTVEMTAKVRPDGNTQSIYSYYHPTRPPDDLHMTADTE